MQSSTWIFGIGIQERSSRDSSPALFSMDSSNVRQYVRISGIPSHFTIADIRAFFSRCAHTVATFSFDLFPSSCFFLPPPSVLWNQANSSSFTFAPCPESHLLGLLRPCLLTSLCAQGFTPLSIDGPLFLPKPSLSSHHLLLLPHSPVHSTAKNGQHCRVPPKQLPAVVSSSASQLILGSIQAGRGRGLWPARAKKNLPHALLNHLRPVFRE